MLVDDEPRAGARRGLVAEEALALGLGRDVDDALVHRGVDQDVVPLFRVELLEHVFGRGGGRGSRGRDGGHVSIRIARGPGRGGQGGAPPRAPGSEPRGFAASGPSARTEEDHHERQSHDDRDGMSRNRPPHRRPFQTHQRETPRSRKPGQPRDQPPALHRLLTHSAHRHGFYAQGRHQPTRIPQPRAADSRADDQV